MKKPAEERGVFPGKPSPIRGERDRNIDALRGAALLGVLLLNLLTEFRFPFLACLQQFHTEPGALNHAVDWFVGLIFERKCFAVLCVLFGAGLAAIVRRSGSRSRTILLRRLDFLLAMGLFHILFVFSGDILTHYAICGLVLLPILNGSRRTLWTALALALTVRFTVLWPSVPIGISDATIIEGAFKAYGSGSFLEALQFRLIELRHVILPLLTGVAPRTLALIIFGFLAWQGGWISKCRDHPSGRSILLGLLAIGTVFTALEAMFAARGTDLGRRRIVIGDTGVIGLALGYCAWFIWMKPSSTLVRRLAPLGQLSLTGYLIQTLVLAFTFYGYGTGLYGKLGSFAAAMFGIAFYAAQVGLAGAYLSYRRVGPLEWIWRRFTYGAAANPGTGQPEDAKWKNELGKN